MNIEVPKGKKLFRVKIGTTLHLFIGGEMEWVKQVDEHERRARRTGEVLEYEYGKVFYTKDPIVDTKKSGSAQYIWSKDGNRVKHKITRHEVMANARTAKVVGTCFADLD